MKKDCIMERNDDENALMLKRLLDTWKKNERERILNERELITNVATNLMLIGHQKEIKRRRYNSRY